MTETPKSRTYPGSRWWKMDFHTHTPASLDTPWSTRGVAITPEDWLLRFMSAGIDCVAVTDHNSGAWVDKLRAAYEGMTSNPPPGFRELHLFPGVEISVNGGFHVLALFDVGTEGRKVDLLLGRVRFVGKPGESDDVTGASAVDVVQAIEELGGLAIPAHVDGLKGLLQLASVGGARSAIDPTTLRQVLDSRKLHAIEVVDPCARKPQIYIDGRYRLAEVIGSDCHGTPDSKLGARFTWLKMATPSLEGVRLALLDGAEVSVRRSDGVPPPIDPPAHFVERIEISEARAMGRGTASVVPLNPWFNAIVGGRGTGKSTLVHALRLAYRRENELVSGTDPARVFEAFRKPSSGRDEPGGLRPNTEIRVELSRLGQTFRLRFRTDGAGDAVEERHAEGWQRAQVQQVSPERFPIRIFSQGQIAALSDDRTDALLRLIGEVPEVRAATRSLEDATAAFLRLRARAREFDGRLAGLDAMRVQHDDVVRKLAGFERLSHAETLKTFQIRSRQSRELERQLADARALETRIRGLAAELVTEEVPPGLFAASEAADASAIAILDRIRLATERAAAAVLEASTVLATELDDVSATSADTEFHRALAFARTSYEALTTQLRAEGIRDPSEYGRLVQERQSLEGDLARLTALRAERDGVVAEADAARARVRDARRALSEARRAFVTTTLADNLLVRIEVETFGRDPRAVERSLRSLLALEDARFATDLYEADEAGRGSDRGIVADLLRDLPPGEPGVEEMEARLDGLVERFARAARGEAVFPGRFGGYLQKEFARSAEMSDRLALFSPEDAIRVAYSPGGDGRTFQPIDRASAGQRAAAMLAFLLSYGDEPLVLDQPEDDLDNHLIYELVVRQIRENKMRRQLFIATHNPNIVVNGDAELVHALRFKNGQCVVGVSGALQQDAVREEVCQIMEGGREALERRYQRLGEGH